MRDRDTNKISILLHNIRANQENLIQEGKGISKKGTLYKAINQLFNNKFERMQKKEHSEYDREIHNEKKEQFKKIWENAAKHGKRVILICYVDAIQTQPLAIDYFTSVENNVIKICTIHIYNDFIDFFDWSVGICSRDCYGELSSIYGNKKDFIGLDKEDNVTKIITLTKGVSISRQQPEGWNDLFETI